MDELLLKSLEKVLVSNFINYSDKLRLVNSRLFFDMKKFNYFDMN